MGREVVPGESIVTESPSACCGEKGRSDQAVVDAIAVRIGEVIAGAGATVRYDPLVRNVFSMGFRAWIDGAGETRAVFVKIPKDDLRRRVVSILPLSSADRNLAVEEFRSLEFLEANWPSEETTVSFIKPLAFLDDYNAIVTEWVAAEDGCAQLRRWDLRRRAGDRIAAGRMEQVMSQMGRALRIFHQRTSEPAEFELCFLAEKIVSYADRLAAVVTKPLTLSHARKVAERIANLRCSAATVSTLKGIDVRNVLLAENQRVILVDPGKRKRTVPEADVARFLMSYRILWWGSPGFLVRLCPSPAAEAAFFAGYGEEVQRTCLFRAQMIKEVLKHWLTAHDSLGLKKWPAVFKQLLAAYWIDPCYARLLRDEACRVL